MRFLGNKTRMLKHIDHVIADNHIGGRVFCDAFSGTCAVGDYFKGRYSIIANDFLYSLSVIAKAKLENSVCPAFETFVAQYGTDPFTYFNRREYVANEQYFVTQNYSPVGNRRYFSEENATKIDGIRIELENLYGEQVISERERNFLLASLIESVMGVSNTTGTYEAFLKSWDKRALKSFVLEPIGVNDAPVLDGNAVYNTDSNELLRTVCGDILYIDTPYTITDYNAAYHVLESIAKYDYPTVAGITGRRQGDGEKCRYTRREHALKNFEDLFRQAQFEHILVSYSTQGLVGVEELVALVNKFAAPGSVKIYEFPYKEYKNIRSSKKGENLREIIVYFRKDCEIVKSPLNYTGSKYGVYREIEKAFPKHVSAFVDLMGGAFNVGVNAVCDRVVYNEYLPYVYDLVALLLHEDKTALLRRVEEIVAQFGLRKGEKEPYLALRRSYNETKDIYKLFVLHMYCFQNQMRFNAQKEFNCPVGNSSYNETMVERVQKFLPRTPVVELWNKSFADVAFKDFDKDTLFYIDPPYFITSATYNDGKRGFVGWNAEEEAKLLKYLTALHQAGYKFILSNVLYHNGNTNFLLEEWVNTYKFRVTELGHVGSKNARNEVLITNFDWRQS